MEVGTGGTCIGPGICTVMPQAAQAMVAATGIGAGISTCKGVGTGIGICWAMGRASNAGRRWRKNWQRHRHRHTHRH